MSDLPATAEALARFQAAAEMPAPMLTAAGLGVAAVAGLAMWAAGGRLVRPLYALALAAIGAVIGLWAQQAFSLNGPAMLGVGVGAVVGGAAGLTLFRLTMAAALAVALGAAAPLAAAWALHPTGVAALTLPDLPAWDTPPRPEPEPSGAGAGDEALERLRTTLRPVAAVRVNPASFSAIESLAAQARADWSALPDRTRGVLALSAVGGAIVGFGIGLARPRYVAAMATSLTGAAVWIPASLALLPRAGVDVARLTPDTPKDWITTWLTVAAVGAMIQVISLHGRADKTAG